MKTNLIKHRHTQLDWVSMDEPTIQSLLRSRLRGNDK